MKRVTFLIEEEILKKVKIKAINKDQNMTEYLIDLIEKDLRKVEEDAERNC